MEAFLAVTFLASAVAVVPAFAASIYCSYLLNRYLRREHPEIWSKVAPHPLAEPSLSSPNSRFVTQRVYRTIKDEHLNALGDRCYRLLYLAVTIFLILVLSGLSYDALS